MKRLIRKAFAKTLYHGTSYESLKAITEMGMITPQENGGAGLTGEHIEDAGRRADARLREEGYSRNTPEYNGLFETYKQQEIDKDQMKFQGYTFFTDKMRDAVRYSNELSYDSSVSVVIEVSVPEESLLPDDNDCPECLTWQDILRKINQVKVLGPITEDYIVGVHFFHKSNGQKAGFYPKLTWKNQ